MIAHVCVCLLIYQAGREERENAAHVVHIICRQKSWIATTYTHVHTHAAAKVRGTLAVRMYDSTCRNTHTHTKKNVCKTLSNAHTYGNVLTYAHTQDTTVRQRIIEAGLPAPVNVQIIRNPLAQHFSMAFVEFSDEAQSQMAMQVLHRRSGLLVYMYTCCNPCVGTHVLLDKCSYRQDGVRARRVQMRGWMAHTDAPEPTRNHRLCVCVCVCVCV
jgi:hypothetical protein